MPRPLKSRTSRLALVTLAIGGAVAVSTLPACGGFDDFALQEERPDLELLTFDDVPPPVDSTDGTCKDERKICDMRCVAPNDPAYGCAAGCGKCDLPNGTAGCHAGACAIAACATGFADCNRNATDGCEVDKASNHENCGACGRACAPKRVCSEGACVDACRAGLTACTGACVDLATSHDHCGRCGGACGANEVCDGGACKSRPCGWVIGGDGPATTSARNGRLAITGNGPGPSAGGLSLAFTDVDTFDASVAAPTANSGSEASMQTTCGISPFGAVVKNDGTNWSFYAGPLVGARSATAPIVVGPVPRLRLRRANGVLTASVSLGDETLVSMTTTDCEGITGITLVGQGNGKWLVEHDDFRQEGICSDDFTEARSFE